MILAKLFKLRLFNILVIIHSEITATAKPSTAPYAKRWQRSGGLQCPCIYRIKLDFRLRENAMKEIQDTIDSAGMAGQVKIF